MIKKFVKRLLSFFSINSRLPIVPGISIFGHNFFYEDRKGARKYRSIYAFDHAITLRPDTVLDVGSGGGVHADLFKKAGCRVLCIDFGTSIYAQSKVINELDVLEIDFYNYESTNKFDLVWASHVLEHQRNIGIFIEKLIAFCSDHGSICITVPDPHRTLWGGHLSIWSPGILAYNIVLCGVDLSKAYFVRGSDEFSIFFKPIRVSLPSNLTYDSGDLIKLSKFLPDKLTENSDPWKILYK